MTPEEKAQEIVIHLHGPDGDSLYHTKKVIADAIKLFVFEERLRCAKIAERVAGYYSANNGDNKDVALLVAQEIREGK